MGKLVILNYYTLYIMCQNEQIDIEWCSQCGNANNFFGLKIHKNAQENS